jgi:hypothetical protein
MKEMMMMMTIIILRRIRRRRKTNTTKATTMNDKNKLGVTERPLPFTCQNAAQPYCLTNINQKVS